MKNYKAVCWDIDGVVVLSEDLHVQKINGTARKYGIILSQNDWENLYGIGDHRVFKYLEDKGLSISEDQFIDECLDYYTENKSQLIVRPGFIEVFNHFSAIGVRQVTVSSGVEEQVRANLSAANIGHRTEFNLTATDITSKGLDTKPAPDPFNEARRMLNESGTEFLLPEDCLVIEDSSSGVKSGNGAGMDTLHWRLDKESKKSELANYHAHDRESFIQTLKPL